MGLSQQLITEEVYKDALSYLKTMNKDGRRAIRLRAIVSAKENGVNIVAKIFGTTSNTLRNWVKSFKESGLEGLDYQEGRGRKSKLSDDHRQKILSWVKKDPSITIREILIKLKEQFEVESSKSAVHRILHELKLSYITPRPIHHKQNKSSQDEFKKKSKG